MSRYIDADALRHRVLYFADARNLNGNHEQAKAYNHCLCMIDEAPTADVAEVVHGEWIDHSENGYVECPICYSLTTCDDDIEELHFCFSCGAKLRGGTDDN